MNEKKILWIELLRIVCCLAVIMLHMGAQYFRDLPVGSYSWNISNIYHGITRFAVNCFVMISGCLYLDKSRRWSFQKVIRYTLPIVVAFVFWQFFYAVFRIARLSEPNLFSIEALKMICYMELNSYFHLWYLPTLIGLILVTPLMWKIVNGEDGKRWTEFLLALFFIFHTIPNTVDDYVFPYKEYIMYLINLVQLPLIFDYLGCFLLGHYLYNNNLSCKFEMLIYFGGILSAICGVYLCQYYSIQYNTPIEDFYQNYTVVALLMSTSVFLLFKTHISRIKFGTKVEKMIILLGSHTFGIYLLHIFVRDMLQMIGLDALSFNTIVAIPTITIVIFVTSSFAVVFLKKIPLVDKWLM